MHNNVHSIFCMSVLRFIIVFLSYSSAVRASSLQSDSLGFESTLARSKSTLFHLIKTINTPSNNQ